MKLLHVAVFGFSGGWVMMALWQGLRAMCETSDIHPRQAIRILQLWILILGFVGNQMAWSLRSFVGSPDLLHRSSQIAVQQSALPESEVDQLLRESME